MLSLFSAAVNGFGAGVLWVAQGKYVGECANDKNKGFFFGYFWAFFMASQVLGNLIAALILGPLSQSTYYIVMTIAAFSGTSVFLFLKKPLKSTNEINISGNSEIKLDKSDEVKAIVDTDSLIKQEVQ